MGQIFHKIHNRLKLWICWKICPMQKWNPALAITVFIVNMKCTPMWTRHVFVKHRCPQPAAKKSKIWQNLSKSYILTLPPYDIRVEWAILRWTYSPSLVTVSPIKLLILHFVSGTELWTNGQTDCSIARCPQWTFQAGGIKIPPNPWWQ